MYFASCASGLESVLLSEAREVGEAYKLSDTRVFGGVCLPAMDSPETVYKLRSIDNVYAFLGHFQDVPMEKDAAITYFKNLVEQINWQPALEILRRWKAFLDKENVAILQGDTPSHNIKFRVTCDRKCIQMKKHDFKSVDAAAALGDGIQNLFGWAGDMRGYDVEVIAWIRDAELLLVLALLYSKNESKKVANCTGTMTPKLSQSGKMDTLKDDNFMSMKYDGKISVSLPRPSRSDSQLYSHRRYRHSLVGTSLKPSVAYALLQLGDIRTGHIVVDPMCGCGTIPLEANDYMAGQIACLAGDISSKAVCAARGNAEDCEVQGLCDVLQWDATKLSLRSNCVDRVVCDMPFGVRCGSSQKREWLCPKVLREIVRILRPDTGIAVLLSHSKSMRREMEKNQKPFLHVLKSFPVEMEGIRLEVIIMQRTTTPVPIQISKIKRKFPKRQDV